MIDPEKTPRRITVEFNDSGGINVQVDPRLGISEIGAVVVMLGWTANRMLDEQFRAQVQAPAIVRASSIPAAMNGAPK